jgi:D-alanyl-D-alanine carboxypeptidase (penicillin-binding protein 5/6)
VGDVEERRRDRQRGAQLVRGVGCAPLLFGDVCLEPGEHGVEGVGELAELVSASRELDPVGERSVPAVRVALLPGQRDVAAVARDLAPERVEPQACDLPYGRPAVGAPAAERPEPEHELLELERLRQLVVGAELEPGRLVVETEPAHIVGVSKSRYVPATPRRRDWGMAYGSRARPATRRIRIRRIRAAVLLLVAAAIAAAGYRWLTSSPSTAASPVDLLRRSERGVALGEALPSTVWPAYGQAAFIRTGQSQVQAGPNQHPAAIASVAKVMTAYLVLRDHPLLPGQDGPTITLTEADVADTDRRRGQKESIVSVAAGEQLTELQALQALLLPSANNIAAVLARWDAGSTERFVARMNATARSLGMTRTRYTDPSGYDDATVSTAADQVRIVDRAMRVPVFASIVATPSATLPVAGTVRNTDTLLGLDGFVGVKTGSDDAAGGCFAFRAVRWVGARRTTITGVVLGQPGRDRIAAGLAAAAAMVDRIAGRAPVGRAPGRRGVHRPGPPPRRLPAPT